MRKRILVLTFTILLAFGLPSVAFGGSLFTLHPAGRGQQSYASWKANVGELDSGGSGSQALYFQKMTTTGAAGMGVVVIRGLVGQNVSVVQGLSWDRPSLTPTPQKGSYCGTSPHWRLGYSSGGVDQSIDFGPCFSQTHTPSSETPATWTNDSCTGGCLPVVAATATINSLAIIYEDGTDRNAQGYVLLDNVSVLSSVGSHTWMSASDNATASINFGATVALADQVSDILADLLKLFPDVPVTEWTLYPGVDLLPLP